ncbi:DUF6746 family protein [Kangiella shandongensis]|uniref:DUF6746 family protein n=1 Tax=Kangiella shandongensis TaxID=2763258 RepID=UPI001CBD2CDD|nr:DUF6746 family protein [Kangiella shandongensis]
MKLLKLGFIALSFLIVATVSASEIRHYKGEDVNTVEEAISVLKKYNTELEKLLKAEELKAQDMAKIHQMTYSMENALEILEGSLNITQRNLEELHLSSETMKTDKAQIYGQLYLEGVSFYTEK